jgi:hypothetical protein
VPSLDYVSSQESHLLAPFERGTLLHKRVLLKTFQFADAFGLNVIKLYKALIGVPAFIRTFFAYKKALKSSGLPSCNERSRTIHKCCLHPVLSDFHEQAGQACGHYFHQDLWAAKKIFAAKPVKHIDIGSRIDGFIAHLLVFMPVEMIDIRPLKSRIPGLSFVQEDATTLTLFRDNEIESISSLHAAEHFGLGRYGDTVDPDACFKAMRSMARVLKFNGRLYFSVPIGIERVEFNAHRVISPQTVLDIFDDLSLVSFAAIDDKGDFHSPASPEEFSNSNYACGLFEFTKKPA